MAEPRILCVDDDPNVLRGIERQQGDDFDICTALGPEEALEMIADEGPFAVVLSDMRMPGMNGVELLDRIRQVQPDTVRMILTGYAELQTTIDAVNKGHIFRFLSKPCSEQDLAKAFHDGLKQYALIRAEKELVEKTLYGSVKVLSEVLSIVSPLAFGQSARVRTTVDALLKRLEIEDQWQLEIAAMLSTLGCVAIPAEVLQRQIAGGTLSENELKQFDNHPTFASELLGHIPRLENVAEMIAAQAPDCENKAAEFPIEKQILKIAIDFDRQEQSADSSLHALSQLKEIRSCYSENVLEALSDYVKNEKNVDVDNIDILDIRTGMVLAEDVRNRNGTLLMSQGQEITASAKRLLQNYLENDAIPPQLCVVVPKAQSKMAAC